MVARPDSPNAQAANAVAAAPAAAAAAPGGPPLPVAPGPPAPRVPPPPPLAPFSLTPNTGAYDVPLNLSTSEGRKMHKEITKPFHVMFDGETESILTFISQLQERVSTAGWNETYRDILLIPTGDALRPRFINLLDEHGSATMEEVKLHQQVFATMHTREAQNAFHMYEAISASLTREVHTQLAVDLHQAKINGIGNGPFLFKLLMQEFTIDTPATTIKLRDDLMHLSSYMAKVGGNIHKFNHYVKSIVLKLKSKGQSVREQDLLIMLFRGFEACHDKTLNAYFIRKKDEFEEGTYISANKLMTNMLNKYNTLVESGRFNKPSEMDRKIVALQAKLKQQETIIKDSKLTLTKNLKAKLTGKRSSRDKSRKKGATKTENSEETSEFRNGLRVYFGPEAWRSKAPEDGSPKSIKKDGKDYHWCSKHQAWVRHKEQDCRFDPETRLQPKKRKEIDEQGSNNKKRYSKTKKVLAAICQPSDDEGSIDSDSDNN